MSLINSTAIPSGASAYEIEQSLRFEDGNSAYLSKTFASAGNQRTWTWSGWVKRGNIGAVFTFFGAGNGGSQFDEARFNGANQLEWYTYYNASNGLRRTAQLFRDTSAWYHIVLVYDSTESAELDRMKVYVNGEQVTVFDGTTHPSQNHEGNINRNIIHSLGNVYAGQIYNPYDGYLAEVNFIDGTAKAPSDFGETGDYGEWKPIEYSSSYGTNGFYLPFKQDYTVEGFSTVLSTGNATAKYVGGVGFQPDFVWNKTRSANQNHFLYDAIRGTGKELRSNQTNAEGTNDGVTAFHPDGFSRGTSNDCNENGITYVDWCWDMGGSNANNTEGTVDSVVRANASYGQSIVSWTGTGVGPATIGHGLSSAPDMIIMKQRGASVALYSWQVYHSSLSGNAGSMALNNSSAASNDTNLFNNTAPTDDVFSLGNDAYKNVLNHNGTGYIAYCFHDVTGYSKFSSYAGNGNATGPTVTTGFRPAFIMVKRITASGNDWVMHDSTRDPSNPNTAYLAANEANAEASYTSVDFLDTGFQPKTTHAGMNASGNTYIYMAFADTREYAYWLDQSGNNNDWTSNNLTESDVMVDSPTNNFATLNPLVNVNYNPTLSEGNLKTTYATSSQWNGSFGTMSVSSGKYYWELLGSGSGYFAGLFLDDGTINYSASPYTYAQVGMVMIYGEGGSNMSRIDNNDISGKLFGGTSAGDVIGIAVDMDNGTFKAYNNNSLKFTMDMTASGHWGAPMTPAHMQHSYGGSSSTYNFGQDSSFAGNKTAQGNQDGNSIGDFYYTPPSGFLALCTSNLPDVAVTPSEHFAAQTRTGFGSSGGSLTTGFQVDFLWEKQRNYTSAHNLWDAVRGRPLYLSSNTTSAESNGGTWLTSFNSNGVTFGTNDYDSGTNLVDWMWKANGSGSSNTDGSITSTVSANVDAGFSIVSYTGTGSATTVGHGLSKTPEAIITKSRNATQYWIVQHDGLSSVGHNMYLQTTNYQQADNQYTGKSATTLTVSGGSVNANNTTYISYCFHSVEGYSKMGVYTGNANADGTFIYTGFRPSLIIVKPVNNASSWTIMDTKVNTFNVGNKYFKANTTDGENQRDNWDFLSNGFKIRNSDADINPTNAVIYLAFAETPFKYSNAR